MPVQGGMGRSPARSFKKIAHYFLNVLYCVRVHVIALAREERSHAHATARAPHVKSRSSARKLVRQYTTVHIIGVRFVVQHRSLGVHAQVPRTGRRAGEVRKWNGDGLVFSCRGFRLPEDDRSSCEQLFNSVVSGVRRWVTKRKD